MATADLTVIIVSWNVRDRLRQCLLSLQRDGATDVIVVDNASSDGSAEMVQQSFPGFALIRNTQNRGFATACNQGIAVAHGRYYLLLNPDTEVHTGSLAAASSYMDAHTDVGILGVKTEHADGRIQKSVLRFPTLSSQLLVLLKIQAFTQSLAPLRSYYAHDFDYGHEADVDQVMGSFFVIRKQVYQALGPLDEQFFFWFEEVDYCKRAHDAGWKVRYTPTIAVTHIGGESMRQKKSFAIQRVFNASMRHYFRKHASYGAYLLICLFSIPSLVLAVLEEIVRPLYAPKPVR